MIFDPFHTWITVEVKMIFVQGTITVAYPPGTQRFCDFGKCSSIKLENKLNWRLNWLWQLNRHITNLNTEALQTGE